MPFQSMADYAGGGSVFSTTTSSGSTYHPMSYSDWQTALFQVKILYLEGQYTQCQARCKQLLDQQTNNITPPHPIHITYLCTYAAICQEFTARALHPLSSSKLPLLLSAREYCLRAISSLFSITSSLSSPSTPSSPLSSSSILSFGLMEEVPSSSCSSPSSFSTSSSDIGADEEDDTIRISPLRIRKANNPDSPLSPTHNNNPSIPPQSPSFISSPFKHHLATLQPLLQSHLSSLNTTITTTHLDQETRHIRLRLQHTRTITTRGTDENDNDEEEMRVADEKKERIQRLRNRGWKRARFEPERYRVLAAMALAEL